MTARFLRNNDGAAALETALVAPIFITMVLAIFQVGWALYCGAEVRHSVERSTRLLIADPDTPITTIRTEVLGRLSAADADDVTLNMTTLTVGDDGQIARLTWTYGYALDAPFMKPVVLDFGSSMVVPLRG